MPRLRPIFPYGPGATQYDWEEAFEETQQTEEEAERRADEANDERGLEDL